MFNVSHFCGLHLHLYLYLCFCLSLSLVFASSPKQTLQQEGGWGKGEHLRIPPTKYKFAGYFPNWAQYRVAPYTYTPENLSPIISGMNYVLYGFGKFDPKTFQVEPVEPKDPDFYQQINQMKSQNPSLKLILSIGGWNFDSAYFSWMVGSKNNRTMFIRSAVAYLQRYNLDGYDFDWEFPCSPPRTDYVKLACDNIVNHTDVGGRCPDDIDNYYTFIQELRQKVGPKVWISIAGQASQRYYQFFKLKELSALIDMWHIMTYDYTVSDIPDSSFTAPNAPLFNPKVQGDAGNWSVNTTVMGYLAAGVPSNKIMLGTALYGHTWYVPGLSQNAWKQYNLTATIQNECCGVFRSTYGAKYGPGSQLCGTLMLSEIQDKFGSLDGYLDPQSQTVIAYSSDGVWISFDNINSLVIKTEYAKKYNLAGVFVFDVTMDTITNGRFTYEAMTKIITLLGGTISTTSSTTSPTTTPTTTPTTSPTTSNFCNGKPDGMYCIDTTHFEWCPQGDIMACATGTTCHQNGDSIICE